LHLIFKIQNSDLSICNVTQLSTAAMRWICICEIRVREFGLLSGYCICGNQFASSYIIYATQILLPLKQIQMRIICHLLCI